MCSEMLSTRALGCLASLVLGTTVIAGGLGLLVYAPLAGSLPVTIALVTIAGVGILIGIALWGAWILMHNPKVTEEWKAYFDSLKSKLWSLFPTQSKNMPVPESWKGQIQNKGYNL